MDMHSGSDDGNINTSNNDYPRAMTAPQEARNVGNVQIGLGTDDREGSSAQDDDASLQARSQALVALPGSVPTTTRAIISRAESEGNALVTPALQQTQQAASCMTLPCEEEQEETRQDSSNNNETIILEATPVQEIVATQIVLLNNPLEQHHPAIEHVLIDDDDDDENLRPINNNGGVVGNDRHLYPTTSTDNTNNDELTNRSQLPYHLSPIQIFWIVLGVLVVTAAMIFLVFGVLVNLEPDHDHIPRDDDNDDDDECQGAYWEFLHNLEITRGIALLELILAILLVAVVDYNFIHNLQRLYCSTTTNTSTQDSTQPRFVLQQSMPLILICFLLETIWLLTTTSLIVFMTTRELQSRFLLEPHVDTEDCLDDGDELDDIDDLSLLGYFWSTMFRIPLLTFQSMSYGHVLLTHQKIWERMDPKWVQFWMFQKVASEYLLLFWTLGTFVGILSPTIQQLENLDM